MYSFVVSSTKLMRQAGTTVIMQDALEVENETEAEL